MYYMGDYDYDTVFFSYTNPSYVWADSAQFTVSIDETGEVLGTYYITIY